MQPKFKPNKDLLPQWRRGIRELAAVMGKEDPESIQKLVLLSARRFVKNVVDITPPAKGKADREAKVRGEEAILGDLLKIAIPATGDGISRRHAKEIFASADQLLAVYERARSHSRGRVNPRSRKEKLLVKQADFQRVLKRQQAKVGFLAAGLNAAAERLGFRLPAWISRHGAAFGKIEVRASANGIRVRVTQNVTYADGVSGYHRQWNFALQREVNALGNQAKAIVQKRAKKKGLKLK